MCPIPLTRLPYHQTGIVCAVAHERPHHDLALEHFLPGGPFAALPMGPSDDALPGGAPMNIDRTRQSLFE